MHPTTRSLLRVAPIALVVLAVIAVVRQRVRLTEAPRDGVGPLPVHVAAARNGSVEVSKDYVAVVEPSRSTDIAARLTARVVEVHVREGDAVALDTPLLELETDDLRTAVDAARAQREAAAAEAAAQKAAITALERSRDYLQRDWERHASMLKEGAATEQQADAARDRFDETAGRLDAARQRLDAARGSEIATEARLRDAILRVEQDARISSPVDGVVTARHVEPGDLTVPGRTLLTIVSRATRLAFDVPEVEAQEVLPGQRILWSWNSRQGTSVVSRIHPALGSHRLRRLEAELSDDAASLPLGTYVQVRLPTARLESVTLVPANAVATAPDSRTYVYAVEGSMLRAVDVRLLAREGDSVAVEGVEPGMQVVTGAYLGWATLGDGRRVEVVP